MQPSPLHRVPPAFRAALERRAGGRAAVSFADFMAVALYEPAMGYYRRPKPRVGTAAGTDFYTAASSPLFGRLIIAACSHLLAGLSLGEYALVEVGAEPGGGIFGDSPHPFASLRTVGFGEEPALEGPTILVSNELFDAQPFRRFRFGPAGWRELGVSWAGEQLQEVELGEAPPADLALPANCETGYVVDAPLAARALASRLAAAPWTGLFLAFDYGKTWEQLTHDQPAGTARAYRHHQQSNDLLADPGEQDLTCHVCWDWIQAELSRAGFSAPVLESQEAFWVHHCSDFIRELTAREASRLSRDKLSLLQLLHPAHMGQKFQVLWALRAKKDLA